MEVLGVRGVRGLRAGSVRCAWSACWKRSVCVVCMLGVENPWLGWYTLLPVIREHFSGEEQMEETMYLAVRPGLGRHYSPVRKVFRHLWEPPS